MAANIAFYGSHNAAVAVEKDGSLVTVIEVERFLTAKNAGYSQYLVSHTRPYLMNHILEYIKTEHGISEFDICYTMNTDTREGQELVRYHELIPAKQYRECLHHESHAACGFYQTNYDQALIVSFDGGGNDGFFNVYLAKSRKQIELVERIGLDLGFPYMSFGEYLDDIRKEPALSIGNLVYSGKIMGLCSYGNVNTEWLPAFEDYYRKNPNGNNYQILLTELGSRTGLEFSVLHRMGGQLGWDVAKTSQIAFENVFMEIMTPIFNRYPRLPIVLVGGCALNILLNTKLMNELGREVFVPPNPNDCGLAVGMILNHMKPDRAVDVTYAGIDILDKHTLMSHVEERGAVPLDMNRVLTDLCAGKIIGVVRGTSEHGPRALGNRSIICNPSYPLMKDILNAKVKNREWYRPFAPVCRLQDASTYFNMDWETRWMSFCPTVREEWREQLVAITHVDGTARVQTVTQEQNPWLYALLTAFSEASGAGVLLNTSFNVNGKPILSRYSDALQVFDKTQMDCLILGDYYFTK